MCLLSSWHNVWQCFDEMRQDKIQDKLINRQIVDRKCCNLPKLIQNKSSQIMPINLAFLQRNSMHQLRKITDL